MKVLAIITALGLAATAALASPTLPTTPAAAAATAHAQPPMLDEDAVLGGGDAANVTRAKNSCRRGHGCEKGRCWRSCNEDEGTWCWMAQVHGGARLSCSSDDTCMDAIKHGTAVCDLSICSDCGCKCW
ncbi:hypothetical protein JDV02_010510 [Purpureocillium takamizusanense]|uniref:Uncharacterized protein n=1 Tax=Purpureocillium takamizusanense TaxID=2060973 RepID=A0A9Q8VGN9_9HYPO|nr:uncharacterized protein JDV02_010510 [Purpureocillium takamizusanense]UNI24786.1 hypothetical protein JDV02_010510 [Purpureocillium takamizusanense]